jgi:hypothetical protein
MRRAIEKVRHIFARSLLFGPPRALAHIDPSQLAIAGLGNRHRQDPVLQIGRHMVDIDRFGQSKRPGKSAVSALDAMKLLARDVAARHGGASPANDNAVLLGVNLDLIPRETGELRREHEFIGGLIEIDGRRPAGRVGADELPDLLVQRKQIAEGVPTRKGH